MTRPTKAPPFLKIKHGDHAKKDAAHVRYIGSRPGVEKVPVRDELAADAAHIEYAGTRPRSTGLFGPDPGRPAHLAEAMKEVGNRAKGPSWRLVLSLREDDARELGVTNLGAWQDLTKRSLAQFAKGVGVEPKHLRWVAAHHPEQGHPHVHVIAWLADEAPRRKGLLSAAELRDVRRGVIKEIFGPLLTSLTRERTMARNVMLETVKENVARAERLLQRIELEVQVVHPVGEGLPPRFVKQDLEILANKIEVLAGIMPSKGQVKLAYMPAEVKEEARAVADWLLSRSQMAETLAGHEKATRELTRLYTNREDRGDEAWEKAYADLRDRVAQVVIRSTAKVERSQLPTRECSRTHGLNRKVEHEKAGAKRYPTSPTERLDVARHTWRSAWRALERERLRAEAKARLASLKEAERAEERVLRERER